MWATHNEPWVHAFDGHASAVMAPGLADAKCAYQVAHQLLVSHGKAVQVFRQGGYPGQIGIVLSTSHYQPATRADADLAACQRAYLDGTGQFAMPLFRGAYPLELWDWLGYHRPQVAAGDLELISAPIDFVGINYYMTLGVSFHHEGRLLKTASAQISAPGWGRTEMDWGINPAGLTAVLTDFQKNYGNPVIYVTENGTALRDVADANGYVADPGRIQFLRAHLQATHEAIRAGANVRGYYVWSLMDNFEWAQGFRPRFGLVRVDYQTLKRIPKQSAYWYRDVIAKNALED
jgi:beta-glucosidase